jgi:hypothetical protein
VWGAALVLLWWCSGDALEVLWCCSVVLWWCSGGRLVGPSPPITHHPLASQPWYQLLETSRHLLPEEEARERLAGESWPLRLGRAAERCLQQLEGESAQLQDDMLAAQEAFKGGVKDMEAVGAPAGPRIVLAATERRRRWAGA